MNFNPYTTKIYLYTIYLLIINHDKVKIKILDIYDYNLHHNNYNTIIGNISQKINESFYKNID